MRILAAPLSLRARGGSSRAPTGIFAASRARGGSFRAPTWIFAASRALEARSGPLPEFSPCFVPVEGRSGPRPGFLPRLVPEEGCFGPELGFSPRLVPVEGRSGPRPGFSPGLVPVEGRSGPRPGFSPRLVPWRAVLGSDLDVPPLKQFSSTTGASPWIRGRRKPFHPPQGVFLGIFARKNRVCPPQEPPRGYAAVESRFIHQKGRLVDIRPVSCP